MRDYGYNTLWEIPRQVRMCHSQGLWLTGLIKCSVQSQQWQLFLGCRLMLVELIFFVKAEPECDFHLVNEHILKEWANISVSNGLNAEMYNIISRYYHLNGSRGLDTLGKKYVICTSGWKQYELKFKCWWILELTGSSIDLRNQYHRKIKKIQYTRNILYVMNNEWHAAIKL